MTHQVVVKSKPATGNGDIAGFQAKCGTRGMTFNHTFSQNAQQWGFDHIAYMAAKEAQSYRDYRRAVSRMASDLR